MIDVSDGEARRCDAEYVLADHILTGEPLDDWARGELLATSLVEEGDLRMLPESDSLDDPRCWWEYVGDRWDVRLTDGEPILVDRRASGDTPPTPDA